MTAPEVARRYGINYRTVVRHCASGRLPARQVASVPIRLRTDSRKLTWDIRPEDARAWAPTVETRPR